MRKILLFLLFFFFLPLTIFAQPSMVSITAVSDDVTTVYTNHIGFVGPTVTLAGYKAIVTAQGALTKSAGLAAALSDETGTGLAVFSASPTFSGLVTNSTDDAVTNTTTELYRLTHTSSGTTAASFGASIDTYLEDASGNTAQQATSIGNIWTTATHGNESSAITFSGVTSGGALTEWGRLYGSTVGSAGTLQIPSTYSNTQGNQASSSTGLYLVNNNSATGISNIQFPPTIILRGGGWTGSAAQITEHMIASNPQSNGNPTFTIYKREGGTGAWTNILSIDENGQYATALKFNVGAAAESITLGFQAGCDAAATAILDVFTPYFLFKSLGWKTAVTAASQYMSSGMFQGPEQGVTNPIGVLKTIYGTNATAPTIANELIRYEWGDNFSVGMLGSITPQNNAVQINGDLVLAKQSSLGSEKLTANDAGFTGGLNNWTIAGTGYAYSANTVVKNTDGTGSTLTLTNASLSTPLIPGEYYQLQITVTTSAVKGNFTITCGGATLRAATTNAATYTWTFMATSTASLVITDDVTTASRYTLDNVSLKKITDGTIYLNGYLHENIGAAVASADTITPTGRIFHITGVTTINTINLPYTGFSGSIKIIPDGIFATGVTGNIALASTSVVSKALEMVYDESAAKWYPSY